MAPPTAEAAGEAGKASEGSNENATSTPSNATPPATPASPKKEASSRTKKGQGSSESQSNQKAAETTKNGKTSEKEAKDAIVKAKADKKAEKQARRAQEKQKQQGPAGGDGSASKQAEVKNKQNRRGSNASSGPPGSSKPYHKRMGSGGQKSLPVRAADTKAASKSNETKPEEKRVVLLDHLYGHPRRMTLLGASKDVHPAVLGLGLQFSSYVVCGSNARCVAMMLAFKQVIHTYTTPAHTSLPRHLTTHLSSQIEYLVSCRPLATSMGNAIRWLKLKISEVDISTSESEAKADLTAEIDTFVRERIIVADQVIAQKAAERIKDGDVIVAYAKSSIVQRSIVKAFRQGKKFKVIAVDTKPLFEGRNLARTLSRLGIDVQYALINAVEDVMESATKVLLGAHTMMSNGRLYSRIGTALVATAASESGVPVIVCCESIKFTDKIALDSVVYNEIAPTEELLPRSTGPDSSVAKWQAAPNLHLLNLMYDLTPAECINVVVTEYGYLPPSSVPFIHRLSTNT